MEEPIATLIELLANLRKSTKQRSSLRLALDEIAAGYSAQRDRAPRRSQGYFLSTRCGVMSKSLTSARAEERLAGALYLRGGLPLPNGDSLKLLDYQFPLKSVNADLGVGKVDLLGLCKDGTLAVVELKMGGSHEDRRIALLEGLIYAAIIEANIEKIAAEGLI